MPYPHPKVRKSEEPDDRSAIWKDQDCPDPASVKLTRQDDYSDNDSTDKNLSQCSNLSCSSDDYQVAMSLKLLFLSRNLLNFQESMKIKMAELSVNEQEGAAGQSSGLPTIKNVESTTEGPTPEWEGSTSDLPCRHRSGPSIVRKKNVKKYKRRKSDTITPRNGNFSSLVQLDLDQLFEADDSSLGTNRLLHRKGITYICLIFERNLLYFTEL